MGLFSGILGSLFGKARFVIMVGSKPALEIKLEGRTITAEIKSAVLAAELGLTEFVKTIERRDSDPVPNVVATLKSMGYKVKVRYGRFELEL